MKRTLNLISVFLFISAVILSGCSPSPNVPTPTTSTSTSSGGGVSVDPETIAFSELPASDPAKIGTTGRPQVIDFFAYWCTTCKAMHPVFASLEKEYAGRVDFLYIDIDAENTKDAQRTFNFTGLRPTIIFLDANGKEVNRLFGERPREEIASILDNMVAVGG
ncbi:MAG: thioredoxin fold domain-containing protein [Anaerolinea sp.]|nr:thioredoxin fold domain-containing protein [Anaerolinea sp.]